MGSFEHFPVSENPSYERRDETSDNSTVNQEPPWMEKEGIRDPDDIATSFLAKHCKQEGHALAYQKGHWMDWANGRLLILDSAGLDGLLRLFMKSRFEEEFARMASEWLSHRSDFPSADPPTLPKVTVQLIRETRWMLHKLIAAEPLPSWLQPS
jgi:hypothetical protein